MSKIIYLKNKEGLEEVVKEIRAVLTGNEYISVATHQERLDPQIEIRQTLKDVTMWWNDETKRGGATIHDKYGVWPISMEAQVVIENSSIEIQQQAPGGDEIYWVFKVTGRIITPLEYVLLTGKNYHARNQ